MYQTTSCSVGHLTGSTRYSTPKVTTYSINGTPSYGPDLGIIQRIRQGFSSHPKLAIELITTIKSTWNLQVILCKTLRVRTANIKAFNMILRHSFLT